MYCKEKLKLKRKLCRSSTLRNTHQTNLLYKHPHFTYAQVNYYGT